MNHVLIVGAGKGGSAILKILADSDVLNVAGIVDIHPDAPGLKLAKNYHIKTGHDYRAWLQKDIDIIIEATGNQKVYEDILAQKPPEMVVVPGSVAYVTSKLVDEKEALVGELKSHTKTRDFILDAIHDGMIVMDQHYQVSFVNKSAERILGFKRAEMLHKPIEEIIPSTRLPHVFKVGRKEVNQKLQLHNGKKVITTRIPIINSANKAEGAFAVFKDITEVVNLAEEITDLKEIKTMLEAIIQSSEEAITVVDEKGNGLMINPAYTRITGLTDKDVIGKPATADISEGESMHLKVLRTRRPVRGVHLKVGPANKDVIVNVAPMIVDGKLKGSVGVIHDVSEIQSLTSELKRARQIIRNLEAKYTFDDIIAESTEMNIALEQAKVGAKTPATVLLRGESGTGKELFAHAIHNESTRRHNKFIRVNCAAIAESLLESELFGYEAGAFSGAKQNGKRGLFEEAHNGSIFLDEIGELSLNTQAKLLRVLQEGEIVRVGGTNPVTIDTRIIAATNVNLEKAIMQGEFREDLYYRLNRLPIYIPPLRERLDDLPALIHHLIQKLNQDYGRQVKAISEEAIQSLTNYHFPGNVRELENIMGRAMIYMNHTEDEIKAKHIPKFTGRMKSESPEEKIPGHDIGGMTLQDALNEYERQVLIRVLEENQYNKTKTASRLGVSIRNLYYKLDKHSIDKSDMQNHS
ncbi:sigma-54-dependent Fis family transcriptional regulator [Virgibacillus sp. MSP4-1]|uniref:sigma 54-interacting transcriptional regulator n=1 Tax=Virgibacillus sp. MSP4-1 TaxID=2700081 RepID=UPI0003A1097E|nr:sigma-54-dependent Fis family transcriptional regulator [Virgibacillus sp. MSP4-1]QHS22690.1 sigma-54-dependent Fis family transcriptional regulator [Virgibacillus sp. MSP4-1]